MNNEQIQSVLEKDGINIEILCGKVYNIVEKYGVSLMEVAKYCLENKNKIRACQSGCYI